MTDPKFKEAIAMIENGGIICDVSSQIWGKARRIYHEAERTPQRKEAFKKARAEGKEKRKANLLYHRKQRSPKLDREKIKKFERWLDLVSRGSIVLDADLECYGYKGGAFLWVKNLDAEDRGKFARAYKEARKEGESLRKKAFSDRLSQIHCEINNTPKYKRERKYCDNCGEIIKRRDFGKHTSPAGNKENFSFCTVRCKTEWLDDLTGSEKAMQEILDYADLCQIAPVCAGWILSGKKHRANSLAQIIKGSKPDSEVLKRYKGSLYQHVTQAIYPLPLTQYKEALEIYVTGKISLEDAMAKVGINRGEWQRMKRRAKENNHEAFLRDIEEAKARRKARRKSSNR